MWTNKKEQYIFSWRLLPRCCGEDGFMYADDVEIWCVAASAPASVNVKHIFCRFATVHSKTHSHIHTTSCKSNINDKSCIFSYNIICFLFPTQLRTCQLVLFFFSFILKHTHFHAIANGVTATALALLLHDVWLPERHKLAREKASNLLTKQTTAKRKYSGLPLSFPELED